MNGPLIVQSDRTVLLEVAHPQAEEARHDLAVFAELERAPEHVHTYRITRLGLWNARAAGHTAEQMLDTLRALRQVPGAADGADRHRRDRRTLRPPRDRARPSPDGLSGELVIRSTDPAVLAEITRNTKVAQFLGVRRTSTEWTLLPWARGQVKQELLKIGWPAEDEAGYTPGTPHQIDLVEDGWALRPYQQLAVDNFFAGGSGVVVLPCGAGKTLVGAGAMATADTTTLILVTNTVSARQWRTELLKRTTLTEDDIGEYSGQVKEIKPVTIATYQILTAKRKGEYAHLAAARRARLGTHRLRRGAPAARARLQAHRRAAGAPPPRTHRHPRARGRPRIRRLQPHRPEALRRPVEGDRGAGLHLPRLLLRGADRPAAVGAPRVRRERRRRALPPRRDGPREAAGGARTWWRSTTASASW